MAHFTFHGGVELQGHKEKTKDSPIREVLPGEQVVFPLLHGEQEIVVPGEYVLEGQLIAQGTDDEAARIHSSVSGIVKAVEERPAFGTDACRSVVIENDGKYKEWDCGEFVEADDLDNEQIMERIKAAGIVDYTDDGRAVWHKLNIKEPNKIRHIIVNCAECEPYLTVKYRCCVERPEWIVEGLRILLKLFPNAKGILAIANDRSEAITALQKIFADSRNMKIIPLKRKYPQDLERMMIYACTGKRISSSKTPEEARCIVVDCDTVYDICNAVTFGKSMTRRLMTVTGDALGEPANMEVRLGTSVAELIKETGKYKKVPEKIICGGPMRGTALHNTKIPVTKEMNAIVCLKPEEKKTRANRTGVCIGCGFCVDVCSEQLLPIRLARASMSGNREQFVKLGGMECSECGCCSYLCPAHLPLTELIREMKKKPEQEEG